MTQLERAQLELTESQLTAVGERINHWSTKDKVIGLMRYKYCRSVEDQAA